MEQNPTRKSRLSSGQFSQRTEIDLKPSLWHARFIVALHASAAIVIALASIPLLLVPVAEGAILISLMSALHRSREVHSMISLGPEGSVKICTMPDRSWVSLDIESVFLSGWLIVLKLRHRHGSKCCRLVCFPDSVLPDQFRRLAVFLRLYGPASAKRSD